MKTSGERFLFDSPGTYQIVVQGYLAAHWPETFGTMTICGSQEKEQPSTTTLTGTVIDQAALMAVLTDLYDMGCTLLEAKRLPDPAASQPATQADLL